MNSINVLLCFSSVSENSSSWKLNRKLVNGIGNDSRMFSSISSRLLKVCVGSGVSNCGR